jgi:hypothetical protein
VESLQRRRENRELPGQISPMMRILPVIAVLITLCWQTIFGWPAVSSASALQANKDNQFCEFFRQTNHWSAGDVATSVPLSDGRVLWFFGDSYIDQFDPAAGTVPCLFEARNSVLVQDTNDWMHPDTLYGRKHGDKSFFRPPDAGNTNFWPCFWPAAGFQNGNTIYVYLSEIQETPKGGMWGFKSIGQSWAKMSFPGLKVTGYVKLPSFNGIQFSCGFVADQETGFTYVFGDKLHGIGSDVYVARFHTVNPETDWTFWDGKSWSDNVTQAAIITHGTSVSVNVCQVKGKFLLVTTAFSVACDQGRDIFVMTSSRPTGPFSKPLKIFSVDDAVDGHYPFFYNAVPHPEFINDDGLLITYCINGYAPCLPTCVQDRMNPDYYRPRAIRLPLRK